MIERLEKFIESQNISVRAFEKKISASDGMIRRAINNKTDIQSKWLALIAENYPHLNIVWLITGKGMMLKQSENSNNHEPVQFNVPIISYLERTIKDKDEKIEQQAQEIGRLREINENLEEDNQKLRQVIVQLRNAGDASDVVAAS